MTALISIAQLAWWRKSDGVLQPSGVLSPAIIFDRNLPVSFHKLTIKTAVKSLLFGTFCCTLPDMRDTIYAMKTTQIFMLCLVACTLLAGCATHQTNVVRQTLQTYQVGVTKFKDFKKDADLIELAHQTNSPLPSIRYEVSKESPWKLYGQGEESTFHNWVFTKKWKYEVGDSKNKICTLWFDANGTLVNISMDVSAMP